MKKILVKESHAYLMEDGEILICEKVLVDHVVWSASLGAGTVNSPLCKYIIAYPLGWVGSCNEYETKLAS